MINKEVVIILFSGYRLGFFFIYLLNLQCFWFINNFVDKELIIVFDDNFDIEVDFDILIVSINFYSKNFLIFFM